MELEPNKIEALCKMCHDLIRSYCQVMGDYSLGPWESTPDDIKEATRTGVIGMLKNPDMTSQEAHETWCQSKQEQGWVYGETKDAEAKTHPSLIPYGQLSSSERFKDALFRGVVSIYLTFKDEG